jgi:hypothetical protein
MAADWLPIIYSALHQSPNYMVADAHGSDEAVLDRLLDFALPAMLCQALKGHGQGVSLCAAGLWFQN